MRRRWTVSVAVTFVLASAVTGLSAGGADAPATVTSVTEFPLPNPDSRPYTIVTGPDGNLWFTESDRGAIGRITPTGEITEFELDDPGSKPYGITVGADGNLWFTERLANQIGKITTSGVITEYIVLTPNAQPWDITALPDGTLWFTEENVDQVGMIDPMGNVSEYPSGEGQLPTFITTGPDGNVWFTEELGNNIVRLDPDDPYNQTEFPLLTEGALPWDINPGPDGNLWFTELAGRHIGKITPRARSPSIRFRVTSGLPESPPAPSTDACGSPRTTRATSARSRSRGWSERASTPARTPSGSLRAPTEKCGTAWASATRSVA